MDKFDSRDNQGIQILLDNSDGIIEVSDVHVFYFRNMRLHKTFLNDEEYVKCTWLSNQIAKYFMVFEYRNKYFLMACRGVALNSH